MPMCLPGLVRILRMVLEISRRKGFWDLFRPHVMYTFGLLTPKVDRFYALVPP